MGFLYCIMILEFTVCYKVLLGPFEWWVGGGSSCSIMFRRVTMPTKVLILLAGFRTWEPS